MKEHRDINKDKIKEYKQKYYANNKDKIKELGIKKCLCECGKEYSAWSKFRHEKTICHQNWLKESSQVV